jgi:hypothetical protein
MKMKIKMLALRCTLFALLSLFCGGLATAQAHSVTISFTASVTSGVTGYNIYRSSGSCAQAIATPSTLGKLTTAPITTVTYTDATASTAGSMFCYTVTAVSPNGESALMASGLIQVVIPLNVAAPPAAPAAPSGLGSVTN